MFASTGCQFNDWSISSQTQMLFILFSLSLSLSMSLFCGTLLLLDIYPFSPCLSLFLSFTHFLTLKSLILCNTHPLSFSGRDIPISLTLSSPHTNTLSLSLSLYPLHFISHRDFLVHINSSFWRTQTLSLSCSCTYLSVFLFPLYTLTWGQCDQKKSPNVYKSCTKMISLEKW